MFEKRINKTQKTVKDTLALVHLAMLFLLYRAAATSSCLVFAHWTGLFTYSCLMFWT